MMLRHGWALDASPHGASQIIFRPGISGVPEPRAAVARSGVCAAAEAKNATTQSAVTSKRESMRLTSTNPSVFYRKTGIYFCGIRACVARSRALAQVRIGHRLGGDIGPRQRRRVVSRIAVLAVLLGGIKRMVRGSHQPVRERADLPGPLRDADRKRDRDIRAYAGRGILSAHLQDAAGGPPPPPQPPSGEPPPQ